MSYRWPITKKLQCGAVLFAGGATVWVPAMAGDGTPVSSASTVRSAATPSGPYSIAGDTISYGVGDNVQITSVTVGTLSLTRSAISKPSIKINRIDNATVQGERITLFYPGTVSGSTVNVEGDEALTMEVAMNDEYLTSGGLDVFLNVDGNVEKANNIERIDFVVPSGINLPNSAALLDEIGTVANEKHGNNTYKIAMITAIDAFGEPSAYASLRTIEGNADYGSIGRPTNSSGTNLRNLHFRNGTAPVSGGGNGDVEYVRSDTNIIGLSFVSFAALGATPGQTVYGYSLFGSDMADSNDLVGLTDALLTTSGSANGGDIYGGTFAIFSTPAAEAETSEGAPDLQSAKTVSVYDPTSLGLYAVPGNDVVYTITIANQGDGSPDADSLFMVDSLPGAVEFYNGDFDGTYGSEVDPVVFSDSSSGLTFSYAFDVGYSDLSVAPLNMTACDYDPDLGYDDAVKHVCVQPGGTLDFGTPSPSMSISFRARIK